jgi:hypothetical protein
MPSNRLRKYCPSLLHRTRQLLFNFSTRLVGEVLIMLLHMLPHFLLLLLLCAAGLSQ